MSFLTTNQTNKHTENPNNNLQVPVQKCLLAACIPMAASQNMWNGRINQCFVQVLALDFIVYK